MMTTEITAYEAARQLGLTESQVCRLIRQGKIKARKLGYMWLVDANSLSYRRQKRPRAKKESHNDKS